MKTDNPRKRRNPYIAGKALTSDDGFFGRTDIINKVLSTFENSENNLVVLFGQRRIGKTSILLKLDRALPTPQFFPVLIDLMDKSRKPLFELLFDIASICAENAEIENLSWEAFSSDPDAFHNVFLPKLYEKLGSNRRPVFLLDEFDVLDQSNERLPETTAANSFHPYLRQLISTQPRICFVFAVGRRMEELTVDFLQTFQVSSINFGLRS